MMSIGGIMEGLEPDRVGPLEVVRGVRWVWWVRWVVLPAALTLHTTQNTHKFWRLVSEWNSTNIQPQKKKGVFLFLMLFSHSTRSPNATF